MSEWKRLTPEQVAWLDALAPISFDWAEFTYDPKNRYRGWLIWALGDCTEHAVFFKITDPEAARAAGFPMGEAEQAKAQANAEWQRERRALWMRCCTLDIHDSVEARTHFADAVLAEFDKRFGGDK